MKVVLIIMFLVVGAAQGSELTDEVDEWTRNNNFNRIADALEKISDELSSHGEKPSAFMPGTTEEQKMKVISSLNESNRLARIKLELMTLAEEGNVQAQYKVGVMYENENAISLAIIYYRKAAEQGHVISQNRLKALLPESTSKNPTVQIDTPKFNDYPVKKVYNGKNHPLVLNEFGKTFKTRLSDAIKYNKPVFAGHYLVTSWGCGTSCVSGGIIDAITGNAFPFPVAIMSVYPLKPEFENETGREIIYRLDSNLFILAGTLDDAEDTIQFYEFKNGEFVLLKSLSYGKKSL
jgi:hypothetical protein